MRESSKEETGELSLNWGLVSQYRNQLFGIAILLIMLFHSGSFPSITTNPALVSFLPTNSWIRTGSIGVDLFLFLSGMGLYFAMLRRPSLPRFYLKRLKRILIPYGIIGGAYWFFRDISIRDNIPLFWKDFSLSTFFTDGRTTYWYIALILPLYLLAPLFLRLFRSRLRTPLLFALFAASLGLALYLGLQKTELYWNVEKALNRIFIFVLGCYFGKIIQEKRPMRARWIVFGILVLSCRGLVYYVAAFCEWKSVARIVVRQWYNAAGLALCILLPILLELLHSQRLNRFLNFFGILSLELYLSHLALRNALKILCPDFPEWNVWEAVTAYLGVLLTACLISFLFHWTQTKIETSFTRYEGSHAKQ